MAKITIEKTEIGIEIRSADLTHSDAFGLLEYARVRFAYELQCKWDEEAKEQAKDAAPSADPAE